MIELGIERVLQNASQGTPFYQRYEVLKHRLLNNEYEHWAASFPHGNNHGPGHIRRVMENLDRILGENFLTEEIITPYELFLMMMSILYHDVGILAKREGHADLSGKFLDEQNDNYLIQKRDRDIIRAAVVSHSSSKNIEEECAAFPDREYIGSETVRPRVVAATVRLADELDEDHRRGDPEVARKIGISKDSEFYWQFCQRILAVRPDRSAREIYIGISFEPEDAGRTVRLQGRERLFVCAFAEKLAKINSERIVVSRFLPQTLQFRRLLLSIRPLKGHGKWKHPREFIFNDSTTSLDLVRDLPELRDEPINTRLKHIIGQIRSDLKAADGALQELEDVMGDASALAGLRIYWDRAIVRSLTAAQLPSGSREQDQELDSALQYLNKWYEMGVASAWQEHGLETANEVYQVANDKDLKFLYTRRKSAIEKMLGANKAFLRHHSSTGGGGGGCIPPEVEIETPGGSIRIDTLQPGTTILSSDLRVPPNRIETRVLHVHRSREPICIRVNGRFLFTPSQPLYAGAGTWIRAGDLACGSTIETAAGEKYVVDDLRIIKNDGDVYSLTTDHPTHNFLVSGFVCGNMQKK